MRDSSQAAGAKMLDPVCDMIVSIDDAREHGLTLEMDDREYAFCSGGCLQTFANQGNSFFVRILQAASRRFGIRKQTRT